MCQYGMLDTVEYYDKELPDFHVYSRKLRALRIPEEDKSKLTFDVYSTWSHLAFYVKASPDAWK
jgi:hypothetical protein